MLTLLDTNITIESKNKPYISSCCVGGIKEWVFLNCCFSHIVCIVTALLFFLCAAFPVPGQSMEQESFAETGQRGREGKRRSFESRPDIWGVHGDIF